jgi:hypothetical protein
MFTRNATRAREKCEPKTAKCRSLAALGMTTKEAEEEKHKWA